VNGFRLTYSSGFYIHICGNVLAKNMVMPGLLFTELFLQHPLYSNLTSFNEKINPSFIYYIILNYINYLNLLFNYNTIFNLI